MAEKALVQVTVLDVTPISKRRLLALVDIELLVEGIAFTLHGVQVVRLKHPDTNEEATGVDLPRYRAPDGAWRPALTLPEELEGPIADAALERCCELGITKRVRRCSIDAARIAS